MAAIAVGFFQDSSRGILHCFLSYSVYNYFNKNTRERKREREKWCCISPAPLTLGSFHANEDANEATGYPPPRWNAALPIFINSCPGFKLNLICMEADRLTRVKTASFAIENDRDEIRFKK